MITEQHEFVTAYFIDEKRKNVEVLWQDPETSDIVAEVAEVDEKDESWKHVLKYTNLDLIHENTKQKLKDEKSEFMQFALEIAKKEDYIIKNESAQAEKHKFEEFNNVLFSSEEVKKESLFNIKLSAFELDFVKQYKGRKLKADLRKATSVFEVYKILFEIKLLVEEQDVLHGSDDSTNNTEISE